MAGLEVEEKAESAIGPVLDIKVTPNRGDCLSLYGAVRELAASYGIDWKPGTAQAEFSEAGELPVSVSIVDGDLCARYVARVIRNVKIGPSPQWMQDRLKMCGIRPISNIVDITNYVLLECGQPLHAFDYAKLAGHEIIVRRARKGEKLEAIDHHSYELTESMCVITITCSNRSPSPRSNASTACRRTSSSDPKTSSRTSSEKG